MAGFASHPGSRYSDGACSYLMGGGSRMSGSSHPAKKERRALSRAGGRVANVAHKGGAGGAGKGGGAPINERNQTHGIHVWLPSGLWGACGSLSA